jgi:Leucine-rich repeat (LRR) protein
MPKLSRLILRDNPLGNFINRLAFPTGLLSGLTHLRHLHLDGTGISTLPDEVVLGSSLSFVDISSNYFTEVPKSLKLVNSTLRELDISDNPISVLDHASFGGLYQMQVSSLDLRNIMHAVYPVQCYFLVFVY